MKRLARAFIPLLFLATLSGEAAGLSEKKELEIGKEMHEKILAESTVHPDPELQSYVNQIGQRMAKLSDRNHLTYTFTVIDSPDINAFALPGGYIYIHRGLLTYLHTEAQLAAVLAHEIGHVDARHASRQDTAGKTSSVLSTIAAVIVGVKTGSSAAANTVGQTASLYGTALVRGYGREMELEADELGAEYLLKAGYDPQAMVQVIETLKSQESFSKYKAKDQGKRPTTYHGVFSTHPRNDQRLRKVIASAGTLNPEDAVEIDHNLFREQTTKLAFGKYQQNASLSNNRYFHGPMNFTVAFPSSWKVKQQGNQLVATDPDRSAAMQMKIKRQDDSLSDEQFLIQKLGLKGLRDTKTLEQGEATGLTGLSTGENPLRVAVVHLNKRAFLFAGKTYKNDRAALNDIFFLSAIGSLRPLTELERSRELAMKIYYRQAQEGETFEQLAANSPLPEYAEEQLRLLNNAYPSGEPSPGQWLKLVTE